jgi:hypothetical protein
MRESGRNVHAVDDIEDQDQILDYTKPPAGRTKPEHLALPAEIRERSESREEQRSPGDRLDEAFAKEPYWRVRCLVREGFWLKHGGEPIQASRLA